MAPLAGRNRWRTHQFAVNRVGGVADDSVFTKRELHHLVERRKLAQVRIGRVAWLGITSQVGSFRPYQLDPPFHARPRGGTGGDPSRIISFIRSRKHDWPQARATVTVDTSDDDTGARFFKPAAHSGIDNLILPRDATHVAICADHDASGTGERAAHDAAARWLAEGRAARIAMPPEPGADFNDVLNGCTATEINEARHVAA